MAIEESVPYVKEIILGRSIVSARQLFVVLSV
jgi:hypothetical protein